MTPEVLALIFFGVIVFGGYGLIRLFLHLDKRVGRAQDPRVDELKKILPHENCGVCGCKTCEGYARALTKGAAPNRCAIGGDDAARKIAAYLDVPFEPVPRLRAQVMCSGTHEIANEKYNYIGLEDCLAAIALGHGPKECPHGCIGLGSCVRVCPFRAIKVEHGVAVVEYEKCRACGACINVCPQNLIEMVPFDANVWVGCRSTDAVGDVKRYCAVGCTGCGRCEDVCPKGAIKVIDRVAKIDYEACDSCGACVDVCRRGILWRGDLQIRDGDTITSVRLRDTEEADV